MSRVWLPRLAAILIAALTLGAARSEEHDVSVLTVDASRTIGVVRPLWDEINLWKLFTWFGVHRMDPADTWGDGWLRRHLPWLRYARLVAPLGGNYGPEIAEACDHARATPEHPEPDWECGTNGTPGIAAQNESMRWVDGAWVVDYTPFRTALERVARSGVKPHLNLSSTPAAFSAGAGDFRHYHWNAKPPQDLDGWVKYIRGAFASVEDLDRDGWRVSIINEPNCLIRDENGEIQHVGFASDPEGYARTWMAAARALAEIAPEVIVHPGNYVTSDTFPGEDNLHVYLAALASELQTSSSFSWEDFPYVGLSLYEVPDTTLEDFRSTRIRRLQDAQRRSGLPLRPIKIDELGIHRDVRLPFDETSEQSLRTTRFAGSWYAEALRSFVDAGDVVSSAPWLNALYQMPWKPLPALYSYRMLGLLAGQLEVSSPDGSPIEVRASGKDDGLPRLDVQIEPATKGAPSTLRALATKDAEGGVRLFVVHHQGTPVPDRDPRLEEMARDVRVEVVALAHGSYAVRHASLGGPDGAAWNGSELEPLLWRDDGCFTSTGGRVGLPTTFHMPANSVWLFDVEPRPACPASVVSFRDTTKEAGLEHATESFDATIGDVDGDGRLDLYIANHGAPPVLLDTAPAGPWTNRVAAAGIDPLGDQHGTAFADFDNDGDLDLYVSLGAARGTEKKANRLYRNDGDGSFTDVGRAAGVDDPEGRSRSVAWLDVDRDGRLDLLVANYATPARLFHGRPDGTFADATATLSLDEDAAFAWWTDYDRDLSPDLLVRSRSRLRLLHNEDGRFVDRTRGSGLDRVDRQVGAATFGDADGDGLLDLYLGYGSQYVEGVVEAENEIRFGYFAGDEPKGFDFEADEPELEIFRNGRPLQAEQIQCGMEALPRGAAKRCGAEATADGLPPGSGLVVWRDPASAPNPRWHLRWRGAGDHHLAGTVRSARNPRAVGLDPWIPSGGDLWLGRSGGTFTRAGDRGLEHDANVQMATWADFDNDGWLDLYVVDGGIEGAGRPNLLFLNQGGGTFVRASNAPGDAPSGGQRASAAHPFDYDGDGRLDLLQIHGLGVRPFDAGPYRLYRNESPEAHWIELRLVGRTSNRQGLGTWIELQACGRRQIRYYDGGRGSLSQSAQPIHFGLGECAEVDSVTLRWPSGTVQEWNGATVDAVHEIEEKARAPDYSTYPRSRSLRRRSGSIAGGGRGLVGRSRVTRSSTLRASGTASIGLPGSSSAGSASRS